MKNVSSVKLNAANSPKTPGGISKSLLTPCRRVGLSRNWRNKGPSPFISPLSGNVSEVKEEKIETRKRKERVLDNNIQRHPESPTVDDNKINDDRSTDIAKTPSRDVDVPRRKKSKTLMSAINESQKDINLIPHSVEEINKIVNSENSLETPEAQNIENIKVVSTPVRTKSKKGKKKSPAIKSISKESKIISCVNPQVCNEVMENVDQSPQETTVYKVKENSPNDLRKECIVVIQRKIFKKTEDLEKEENYSKDNKTKTSSQALFDSDSDEVPLMHFNNKDCKANTESIVGQDDTTNKTEDKTYLNEDDDFIDKSSKTYVNKPKSTKSPKTKLNTNKNAKTKQEKVKVQPKPSSQSSLEDDDDDFDNKKTILIKKTYDKVSKPSKAKSTGSITQKDIDELKARIQAKKKLLLAKSITPETEELRTVIKKWQRGCQDALMELLDLMKTKFDDKQDMDYSQMLNTLKIPPSLVGYDAENDCFNSPDDATIILGELNNI